MAKEPTYPKNVPVASAIEEASGISSRASEKPGASDKKVEGGRTRQMVTGAAIGIGSAAIVAALLYANRSKRANNRN
jgi:hypothetical protein